MIKLQLDINRIEDFCHICETFPFDVNVMCGRVAVDGKSIIGVAKMAGHIVDLIPVTQDEHEIESFYRAMKPLGAYKAEEYY